jgi:exopolysaccharide production protein ExoF
MRNLAASAAILLTLSGVGPAAAEPYRLHAQDRVLVRVAAWNFDQNGITEWGGISGEYLIAPDGMLQFPMVGAITAKGQTLTELQAELATILRRNAGLDQPPNLTVELVEGLPVYVLGAAQTRGAVEFRPGLTPRQALALAGGVYRTSGAADLMQIARIAGDAKLASDELHRQEAERASVEAQLAALDGIISISNTGAHLAGALGLPCVLILDDAFDLAWPATGTQMPVYPSMRIVRRNGRAWGDVLAEARELLPQRRDS